MSSRTKAELERELQTTQQDKEYAEHNVNSLRHSLANLNEKINELEITVALRDDAIKELSDKYNAANGKLGIARKRAEHLQKMMAYAYEKLERYENALMDLIAASVDNAEIAAEIITRQNARLDGSPAKTESFQPLRSAEGRSE